MVDPQRSNLSGNFTGDTSGRKRELELQQWQARLAQRPKTDLGIAAAVLLEEGRALRDAEIGWGDTLP